MSIRTTTMRLQKGSAIVPPGTANDKRKFMSRQHIFQKGGGGTPSEATELPRVTVAELRAWSPRFWTKTVQSYWGPPSPMLPTRDGTLGGSGRVPTLGLGVFSRKTIAS